MPCVRGFGRPGAGSSSASLPAGSWSRPTTSCPVLHVACSIEHDLQTLYSAFSAAEPRTAVIALGPVVVGEEVVCGVVRYRALSSTVWARAPGRSAAVDALAHGPIGSPPCAS